MQNYLCSFQFSLSVRVVPSWPEHWNLPMGMAQSLVGPNWSQASIWKQSFWASLLVWETATRLSWSCPATNLYPGPMSRCARSNVYSYLLVRFFPWPAWWLISYLDNLGVWMREGAGAAGGGLSTAWYILCWNWSFSYHLKIKYLSRCLSFRDLGNYYFVCLCC